MNEADQIYILTEENDGLREELADCRKLINAYKGRLQEMEDLLLKILAQSDESARELRKITLELM